MLKDIFHVECSAAFPCLAKLFPVSPQQEATPLSVIYELQTVYHDKLVLNFRLIK